MNDQEELRRWAAMQGIGIDGLGEVTSDDYETQRELHELGLE